MSPSSRSSLLVTIFSSVCAAWVLHAAGCVDREPTPETDTADAENGLVGHFRYMADVGRFRACGAELEYPIASEGDNAKLERAYLAAALKPAEPLLVRFEGNLMWQPRADAAGRIGDGKEQAWYVERFIAVEPGADCP